MLRSNSLSGRRWLDLSGGKVDFLFAGALILLIVLAVGLTVWHVFFRPAPNISGETGKVFYMCTAPDPQDPSREHGYVFEVDPATIVKKINEGGATSNVVALDCPQCRAKDSCLPATKCPKCGKFYVSERTRAEAGLIDMDISQARDICPYCGQDRDEWVRQRRGK